MSAWDQDPRQLLERLDEPIPRRVDDRVPADSASKCFRFDGKRIELTLYEIDVRMCGTSDGEHCWGHVHAEDVETMIGHEGRHSAWSATNIGNTPDGLSLDQLDESHKQRPVNGVLCRGVDVGASELDIRVSSHVVDGSGARHMVFT